MNNETTETREITLEELLKAFKGKYVDIDPVDHYGITINMYRATLEQEESDNELYFVSRDDEDRVTGSVCISEDAIESIEEYNGKYTINFSLNMTSVDISEYKTLEQMQKEAEEKYRTKTETAK